MDHSQAGPPDAEAFWEHHYGQRDQVWSGKANPHLIGVVAPITPGRALDLGCGEGGDALWLAEQGWLVTAIDISTVALGRASKAAEERGVIDRIGFQRHDLAESIPEGTFDLVSAQFLQSPVELPRAQVFRRAADAVAPGGRLLIVDHAEAPSWSAHRHEHTYFPKPQETLDSLELGEEWHVEQLGRSSREARGPEGELGVLVDNIIVVRRR